MVELNGEILSSTLIEEKGYSYYSSIISVARASGVDDKILLRSSTQLSGFVNVRGYVRTYKSRFKNCRTSQEVLVKGVIQYSESEWDSLDEVSKQLNSVDYIVTLLSKTKLRVTPSKRRIVDLYLGYSISVDRYDKIQAIAWGRLAERLDKMENGIRLHVKGRLQSREYIKEGETVTVREVSISEYNVV